MTRGAPSAAYRLQCLEALDIALNRTPMYASWRAQDPGAAAELDARFSSLPILTKTDIRSHFPQGLVPAGMDLDGALASGEVSYVRTGGTEEEALTNIWNQEWWDRSERASWKLNKTAARAATGRHREAILASALSVGPQSGRDPLPTESRTLGRFLFLNEYPTPAPWTPVHMLRMLEEMDRFGPDVLEANPSYLFRLARFAAERGLSPFQPSLIVLTYELPSALHLRAIRRAFQAPVVSSYGSTEAGYVLMECECGRMHQNAETCRLDFVPLPAAPDVGSIFVTTFGNRWFPLLRFDIGDLVKPSAAPCPCGRNGAMSFDSVEGRRSSLTVTADGAPVTQKDLDRSLAMVDGLVEYALVQETPRHCSLRIVKAPHAVRSVSEDVRDSLKALYGSAMELDIHVVGDLQPGRSGKFLTAWRAFPLDPVLLQARERNP